MSGMDRAHCHNLGSLTVSGDVHIGSLGTFITNTGTTISPESTGNDESTETLLLGCKRTSIKNDSTTMNVKASDGERKSGVKMIGCDGVTVESKDVTETIEASGNSKAVAYDLKCTKGFKAKITGGNIAVRGSAEGEAQYVTNPKS